MFSTDFIFRQQENLVDNQKWLDSGHYATKYYCLATKFAIFPPRTKAFFGYFSTRLIRGYVCIESSRYPRLITSTLTR